MMEKFSRLMRSFWWAVNEAFRDELKSGEKIIFSTKYEDDIIALRTSEGTVLPFQMLSDGYRNVIKIILDIAARMCILNPYLKEKALQETPGIVLIDEIDFKFASNLAEKNYWDFKTTVS